MQLTFGEDAADAFQTAVQHLPAGYTVALLGDHDDLPPGGDIAVGVDVRIEATTAEGVAYRDLTTDAEPFGPIKIFRWEDLHRVHVY
jgi:hypothetical protein